MDRLSISANVPPELAERISDVSIEDAEFDAFDKSQIEDIVGKTLAEPVQNLLLLEVLGIDKVSTHEIVKAIRELHEAMKTAFVEGL